MRVTEGMRIGRLVIGCVSGKTNRNQKKFFVRCDCGVETEMLEANLQRSVLGEKSCGCAKKVHGMWGTHYYEYQSWSSMMRRCYSASSNRYEIYGGRGIVVCDRWHSFDLFVSDIGSRPHGASIERIDNNLDYCPENCRWATVQEQARNRRSNINVDIDGVVLCVIDWCKKLDLCPTTVYARIRIGWSSLRAITTPTNRRFNGVVA